MENHNLQPQAQQDSITESSDRQKSPPMSFYQFPKQLLTCEKFATISVEAKLVYMLLLDRLDLSVKNQWLDKEGKVFILFAQTEITALLGYQKDKVGKLMTELVSHNFILRQKQGQGKPDRVYVRPFSKAVENSAFPQPILPQTSEIPTSSGGENRSQDFGKIVPIKTEDIKTDVIKTHSFLPPTEVFHNLPDPSNLTEGEMESFIIEKIISERKIPPEYLQEYKLLEASVQALSSYLEIKQISEAHPKEKQAFEGTKLFCNALISMLTSSKGTVVKGEIISIEQVYYKVNENIEFGKYLNGTLYSFKERVLERYVEAVETTFIKNTFGYMKAIIWTELQIGEQLY